MLLRGYFLSDDFVPPVLFDQWRARGVLGKKLLTQIWSGLEAGDNHFYRPPSFLTFAINDAAY